METGAQLQISRDQRRRRILRWIGYLFAGGLALLFLLMIAGAIYETVAGHRDRLRFHPPGQLVDVGGHRLHLYCEGEGSPTIILEAGGGNPSLAWFKVQPAVAHFSRVCSYDRAGLGWSDPSPNPPTAKTISEELHTLLRNAGVKGPFVLVGHSLGGMYVRMYAAQYPEDVAAMVLVDSSHPDQDDRVPAKARPNRAAADVVFSMLEFSRRFGLPRLLLSRAAPKEIRPEYAAVLCRPQFLAAVRAEAAAVPQSNAQVRALGTLGNLPLAVLSHDPDKLRFPGELNVPVTRALDEMQVELSHLSTNSFREVVKGSGHDIEIDKPEAVVDAIRKVRNQAVIGLEHKND